MPIKQLLFSGDFLKSLLLTLRVSLVSTIASGFVATLLICLLFIIEESIFSKPLRRIIQIPILVPYITAAYLIGLLLMKSGWISSIAYSAGNYKEYGGISFNSK